MSESIEIERFKEYDKGEVIDGCFEGSTIGIGKIADAWYGIIKHGSEYIVLNDDAVEYYYRVSKKGLSGLTRGVADYFLALLALASLLKRLVATKYFILK